APRSSQTATRPAPPTVVKRSTRAPSATDGRECDAEFAWQSCPMMPRSVESAFVPDHFHEYMMSLDPALRSRIETLLGADRVVLFMKGQPTMPQCGFSAKAVGALQDLGIEFAHVNVLADQEIREGIKAYG